MKTTRIALAVIVGTLAASPAVLAQQATTPSPTATVPGARSTAGSTVPAGPLPQGFSVVLVLGDLQGAASTDDVPQAARKALTDMRDFLPYKSYKLLDAAWVMCCANAGRHIGMPGGQSLRESTSVNQSLRGPEDQEYDLQLRTYRVEGARIFVDFEMSSTPTSPLAKPGANEAPNEHRMVFQEKRKTIIDASFTMDVGETVVVGTSRLKGGSRALIALLTAVAPRTGAAARE